MQIDLVEAEKAILGAVMFTSGECLDDITLTGDDFSDYRLGDVFDVMRGLWRERKPVDLATMTVACPKEQALFIELTDYGYLSYALDTHVELVASDALRRRLGSVAARLNNLDVSLTPAEMADNARKMVDEAIGAEKSRIKFVRDFVPSVIERIESDDLFVPTPWKSLDYAIGGFRPGAVYVVAARPGVGKTVVAAQIAVKLAEQGLVPFASLEMSGDELVTRFISERLQISVAHLKDARMTDRDWELLAKGRSKVDGLQIAIDDRSGVGVHDIRAFVRSVAREGKLSGIVVDYMQLMVSKDKVERHNQVSEFSRQLKIMAKEFNVPVVALSQLNRNLESRSDSVPRLSDLRESGAIEQDADVVMLLRREGDQPNELLVVDVAKNRHGQVGEVELAWDGSFSRALDLGEGV